MERITTKQITESVKRNKWLVIIPALILGLAIFGTRVLRGSDYEAEAVLMVTSNDEEPISYNKLILNEKLANVYAQFLESEDLYDKVAKKVDSDLEAEDIEDKLDYDVNPQAGVISFTYKDSNEDRAKDTITFITEEFRAYAKDYLNMQNIDYLQNVVVKEMSKTRGIIFSILGLIVGALIGLLMLMIKEIVSDGIEEDDDIRELGFEVLADVSNDNKSEFAKIRKKISNTSAKAVIGLSPVDDKTYKQSIGQILGEALKAPVLSQKDMDSEKIKKELLAIKSDKNYIIIDENSLNDPAIFDLADLEDYKIVVARASISKKELTKGINELERLGIKVLGVIYYN
ncbi:YveK family protein [uncultured Anaerococcus sp.]|uniref:YveK family protein n=1 Tax=uncultured Anaerococcus sp. TaxID=293428 RepID=UPI00261708D4|nr:Wzz/FepE/Etk N-terminal domain-containing protein [uncultured Anaerococcus sp.]